MASLLVRDVDAETLARLKARAMLHGRSLQAEAKAILEAETRMLTGAEFLERFPPMPLNAPFDILEALRSDRDSH